MATFERIGPESSTRLFTPGVMILIGLLAVGFMVSLGAEELVSKNLMLRPSGVLAGKVWQFVSYPFIHFCPQSLVFNGLVVLFIGSAIEREWRMKSFLLLWAAVSIVCGVLWVLICMVIGKDYTGMGAFACAYGLLGAFGLLFRGTECFALFGRVKAQTLVWIFLVIGVILNMTQPIMLLWLLGAPVAYGYVKLIWKLASRKKIVRSDKTLGSFVEID